jgi:hypothetical protein
MPHNTICTAQKTKADKSSRNNSLDLFELEKLNVDTLADKTTGSSILKQKTISFKTRSMAVSKLYSIVATTNINIRGST